MVYHDIYSPILIVACLLMTSGVIAVKVALSCLNIGEKQPYKNIGGKQPYKLES